MHAADLDEERLGAGRTFLMPVLRASMAEVAAAISSNHGADVLERVSYGNDATLQRLVNLALEGAGLRTPKVHEK